MWYVERLFCVDFAAGVFEAEAFEGVENLAVGVRVGVFGLVEKSVVVLESGVEGGIEGSEDFFLGSDGAVFVLEAVMEDGGIDDAAEVGLIAFEVDFACGCRGVGHGVSWRCC